jgi:hypothetical protein
LAWRWRERKSAKTRDLFPNIGLLLMLLGIEREREQKNERERRKIKRCLRDLNSNLSRSLNEDA